MNKDKIMYIAFCCDENYLIPACVMLESLIRCNQDVYVVAYSFGNDLGKDSIDKLKEVLGANGELRIQELSAEAIRIIEKAPIFYDYISKATYYRFMLPYIVDEEISRLLYLDCDILIRGNLWSCYLYDIKDAMIGGVRVYDPEGLEKQYGLDKYINAGVLLMELKKIREQYTMEGMLQKLEYLSTKNFPYADQDMLNIIFNKHIELLPVIYNNCYIPLKSYLVKNLHVLRPTVVAHFASVKKPWNKEYCFPYTLEYYGYLKKYLSKKEKWNFWICKPVVIIRSCVFAFVNFVKLMIRK